MNNTVNDNQININLILLIILVILLIIMILILPRSPFSYMAQSAVNLSCGILHMQAPLSQCNLSIPSPLQCFIYATTSPVTRVSPSHEPHNPHVVDVIHPSFLSINFLDFTIHHSCRYTIPMMLYLDQLNFFSFYFFTSHSLSFPFNPSCRSISMLT